MAEARKRMHIHLIDAAINLRKEDPTRKVRVYPPSPGFVAGRLTVQEWFGRDQGWVSTMMWLCCLPGWPVTWHANSHWLTYRHYPASIIPRRNCQLSSLDLAAANHSVDDNKMVEQPISQQLSFDFWRIQS